MGRHQEPDDAPTERIWPQQRQEQLDRPLRPDVIKALVALGVLGVVVVVAIGVGLARGSSSVGSPATSSTTTHAASSDYSPGVEDFLAKASTSLPPRPGHDQSQVTEYQDGWATAAEEACDLGSQGYSRGATGAYIARNYYSELGDEPPGPFSGTEAHGDIVVGWAWQTIC